MRDRTLVEGRFTSFTVADVGKTVKITGDTVNVANIERSARWGDAKHADCCGKIKSVEGKVNGKVVLENEQEFENPVLGSVSDLTTSSLVYGWVKDVAVTGTNRLADCPECYSFLVYSDLHSAYASWRLHIFLIVTSIQQ